MRCLLMVLAGAVVGVLLQEMLTKRYSYCEIECAKEQARWEGKAEAFALLPLAWDAGFKIGRDSELRKMESDDSKGMLMLYTMHMDGFIMQHDASVEVAQAMANAWSGPDQPCHWIDNRLLQQAERLVKKGMYMQITPTGSSRYEASSDLKP